MRLLDEGLKKRFAELGEQDVPDPIIVAHFFHPMSNADWYVTAYYPEDNTIFGWAEILPECGEWGYTSIGELESVKDKFGLGVERDLEWEEIPASRVSSIGK
jgi:hypothetical protein